MTFESIFEEFRLNNYQSSRVGNKKATEKWLKEKAVYLGGPEYFEDLTKDAMYRFCCFVELQPLDKWRKECPKKVEADGKEHFTKACEEFIETSYPKLLWNIQNKEQLINLAEEYIMHITGAKEYSIFPKEKKD